MDKDANRVMDDFEVLCQATRLEGNKVWGILNMTAIAGIWVSLYVLKLYMKLRLFWKSQSHESGIIERILKKKWKSSSMDKKREESSI